MVRALILAALLLSCDMPIQEKYGVSGLITNPNPTLTAKARAGALSVSHNTTHRRPGMVEPRPGFVLAYDLGGPVLRMIPYGGDMLNVYDDSGTLKTIWSGSSNAILDENNAQLDWDPSYIQAAQARGNLYLTTDDAVRKVTAGGTDDEAERVHKAIPPALYISADTGTFLDTDMAVAYRATITRVDANDVQVTSSPSSRFLVGNTGAAAGVDVIVLLHASAAAGDIVRVYRSTQVAITGRPSDDLRLVREIVLTAAHISATYVNFDDDLSDVDRGAALYSNPTREGIERANIAPPRARDLALYRGSLFAGNIVYPHALEVAFSDDTPDPPDSYQTTGTRTNGSAVIAVASATGLKVGQILSTGSHLTNWSGSGPVRVSSISGTDITMTATWNGATDGAPVTVVFNDSIRIRTATEDRYYLASQMIGTVANVNSDFFTVTAPAFRLAKSAEVWARPLSDVYPVNSGARVVMRLETLLPSHAGFEVFATNGDRYEPVLPEPTASTGYASSQDVFPNGVAWSKQDEPEHFMLSRYWLVGNSTPVLRIAAAGDYLYVFKARGDGIYKLSGFGERSGWRVDQVADDVHLLHPDALVVHEDTVFALTNRGLVAINSAGVSDPLDDVISDQTIDAAKNATLAGYEWRAFLEYTRDDEIIMGLPHVEPADDLEAAARVFVYNIGTRAWSTWFDDDTIVSIAVDPVDTLLRVATDAGPLNVERERADTIVNADAEWSVTVSSVSADGLTVTIAGGSDWVPAVGDVLKRGSTYAAITAITSATVFTVHTAVTTGAAMGYEGFTSTITWLPHSDPGGAARKRYSAMYLHWDDTFGVYSWGTAFSGTGDGTDQESSDTFSYARVSAREDTRQLLTADVAFQSQLYTTVEITQADSRWRIGGMALEYREAGRRVWR